MWPDLPVPKGSQAGLQLESQLSQGKRQLNTTPDHRAVQVVRHRQRGVNAMSREEAYACAVALAQAHNLTLDQLANRLLYFLCAGVPSRAIADKLVAMLQAIREKENE